MNWKEIKDYLKALKASIVSHYSYYSKEVDCIVRPSHLVVCMFMLLVMQICSDTPTVRIILENNGSPVVVRNIETTKVIHQRPVEVISQKKAEPISIITTVQAALPESKEGLIDNFVVGDCTYAYNAADILDKNSRAEDWEKEEIEYEKIIKIGSVKYQYYKWINKSWKDHTYIGDVSDLNYIAIKTRCPDAVQSIN